MSSIRRVYFYIVSLVSLGISAAGARILLSLLFDLIFSRSSLISQPAFVQQQLSLGIAMLVIGCPLWFFFWRGIQTNAAGNRTETGSLMRQIYLKLVLIVTSLMALFASEGFLSWLLAGLPSWQTAGGSNLATLIVVAAIWYYHWKVSESEGQPSPAAQTLRRWYIYIASGWGLVQTVVGIIQVVHAGSISLLVRGPSLVSATVWSGDMQNSISWILLGGLFWAFHWFKMSRGDFDSVLRQVYIYLLAITGSSITGIVALVMALFYIFVWVLGAADSGGSYFQFLGWAIPTVVAAAAVWSYHQAMAWEEAVHQKERRLSSRRVHLYIMSFLGLGAMVAGLVLLLGIPLQLAVNSIQPPLAVEPGWWQKQVSLFLALLITAFPLWWIYWKQVIRLADRRGVEEWRARSRRTYLYVIIGASIIALAADLVNIFYQILSAGLSGGYNAGVLRSTSWSIQSLVVAVPLLVYHWKIARDDQRRGAEKIAGHKAVTVLAGREAKLVVSRLEEGLGYKISVLQSDGPETDPPVLTEGDLKGLVEKIESASSARVMVVISEGRIAVIPYHPA
ncbi:MAG: hypothetical protein JXA46_05090 [Dehalococcoidales bacterium]|nr:hypothetical protein [Dehalococcoidales bacterium]